MATSDEEVMQKISEEMAQHYNKNYAKFGPMGKMASDSNAVTESGSSENQTEVPSSPSTSGVEDNYTSSVYGLLGGFG